MEYLSFLDTMGVYASIEGDRPDELGIIINRLGKNIDGLYCNLFFDERNNDPINDDNLSVTPIMYAALLNNLKIVEMLLPYSDIKQQITNHTMRPNGFTVLNQIVGLGDEYMPLIEILLENGADPNKDNSLDSDLQKMESDMYNSRYFEIRGLRHILSASVVNMLLEAGVDPSKVCNHSLEEDRVYELSRGFAQETIRSVAYAFDAGIPFDGNLDSWKKALPEILKQQCLNPESRWIALDKLENKFFSSVGDFSIVGDEDKLFFEQIQSAKEAIKKQAKESLIQRAKLDFNNETIAERYRTIAQRMWTEYKNPAIEDALARIDTKVFAPTQVLPKDIKPKVLEVLKEPELRQNVTKFLSLNDAKSLKDAFDMKVHASNMDISPRFSPKQKQEDEKSFAQREEKRRKLDPSSHSNDDL